MTLKERERDETYDCIGEIHDRGYVVSIFVISQDSVPVMRNYIFS